MRLCVYVCAEILYILRILCFCLIFCWVRPESPARHAGLLPRMLTYSTLPVFGDALNLANPFLLSAQVARLVVVRFDSVGS